MTLYDTFYLLSDCIQNPECDIDLIVHCAPRVIGNHPSGVICDAELTFKGDFK